MAINTNASTSLAGIYKEVYKSGDVTDLVPNVALLAARIPFSKGDMIGNKFHVPLRVRYEHSIAYAAAGTTPTWSAATYANGVVADAQIDGSQIAGRAALDYEAIMKAQNGDKAAFVQATAEVVRALANATAKRREATLIHGRRGWGTIESVSGSTLTITAATWSPGLWAGMTGMSLDCYANDGTTARTNSAADTISSINMSTRVITLGNSVDASWLAGDFIFPETASGATEFIGLDGVANSTGTLYNIAGSTYELMQGNVIDSSTGLPSLAKLFAACGELASYGARGNIIAVMPPKAFEVINSDQAGMRMYPQASAEGKNGFKGLTFYGQCGTLELMPHPFQKNGQITLFTEGEAYRIGASDLNFIRRQGSQDTLTLEISTAAASEMRIYSSQALVVECPRHVGTLSGVTY